MLSKSVEFYINTLFANSRENRLEFVTVEHLLLAILDDKVCKAVINRINDSNHKRLKHDLISYTLDSTPILNDEDEREPLKT